MNSSNRFSEELKELERKRPKGYDWSRRCDLSVNEYQDYHKSKEKSLKNIWSRTPDNYRSLADIWDQSSPEMGFVSPLLSSNASTSDAYQALTPPKSYDQKSVPTETLNSNIKSWSTPLVSLDSQGRETSTPIPWPVQEPPLSSSRSHEHSIRYLSDSLSFMTLNAGLINDSVSVMRNYHVIKAINIPWCVSIKDIKQVLNQSGLIILPTISELSQCVHITMDIKTGKTLGVAFIECKFISDRDRFPDLTKLLPVQGRRLRFTESSYDELLRHLFPEWPGHIHRGLAYSHLEQEMSFFLSQKDLQDLLNICRNYKVYYNRKCAERPYEYLISITMNIPWNQPRTVTTVQRDLIYECYKLATETLKRHTEKGISPFEKELLPKLVRTAIVCPGFSIRQKNGILSNAKMECPEDLKNYMEETATIVDSTILDLIR